MENRIKEDLALYAARVESAKQALRDAQFDLRSARTDLQVCRRAARWSRGPVLRALLNRIGAVSCVLSITNGRIVLQTVNLPLDRVQGFRLVHSRKDLVTEHHHFVGTGELHVVSLYNTYDPRRRMAD